RNVISGQYSAGIFIANTYGTGPSNNNLLQGNYIGTDKTGTVALEDLNSIGPDGIDLFTNPCGNTVGGTATGAGKLTSGERNSTGERRAIEMTKPSSTVQGNLIGTKADGTGSISNFIGIEASGANDIVGGTSAGASNLVANSLFGGLITSGNVVTVQGITVQGNTISNNSGLGIRIAGNGAQVSGNTISGNK